MEWDRYPDKLKITYKTLQRKECGGMGLPCLQEYYHAAQLRPLICLCTQAYSAKWKEIESAMTEGAPIRIRNLFQIDLTIDVKNGSQKALLIIIHLFTRGHSRALNPYRKKHGLERNYFYQSSGTALETGETGIMKILLSVSKSTT